MEFENEAQKSCYETVATWLKEIWGEAFLRFSDDVPAAIIDYGSTLGQVAIVPWGDDDAVVAVRAIVVREAELSKDLLEYLLRKNHNMRFGAFEIDDDGNVIFRHTIVGSTCDKNEKRPPPKRSCSPLTISTRRSPSASVVNAWRIRIDTGRRLYRG